MQIGRALDVTRQARTGPLSHPGMKAAHTDAAEARSCRIAESKEGIRRVTKAGRQVDEADPCALLRRSRPYGFVRLLSESRGTAECDGASPWPPGIVCEWNSSRHHQCIPALDERNVCETRRVALQHVAQANADGLSTAARTLRRIATLPIEANCVGPPARLTASSALT